MKQIELNITNDLEELHRVNGQLEEVGEAWNVPLAILMNVNLCMEEALSNVIFYAFEENEKATIDIRLELTNDGEMIITIEDSGKAFNPLESIKEPEKDIALEDRKIGGLGIFFITQFMDRVTYNRIENRNQLKMFKNT